MANSKSDQVIELLEKLRISYRIVEHEPVFTVQESSQLLAEKTPVKNLLLEDVASDKAFLVIMSGTDRLDTKNLSSQLGVKKLRFAKPDRLMALLGVTPGSVSLFSLLNAEPGTVELIVDKKLLSAEELGFHPNDNRSTIFLSVENVFNVIEKIFGSSPKILFFSE